MSAAAGPMSAMAREIRQAPAAMARFLSENAGRLEMIGGLLRQRDPAFVVTSARGSSDHAASYFKYLCEILAGVPVASIGPSVASLYRAPLRLAGGVIVSVSQSGRSPDIVALQNAARKAGALALCIVNDAESELARGADLVLPLLAGPETSVAATKSFLTSALALAAVLAHWQRDEALLGALAAMPEALSQALAKPYAEAALVALAEASSAYIIGRGPGYAMAQEAALKLKETAMLHAEPFSGAEVMHGPLQLVQDGFPVLAFRPRDAAHEAMGAAMTRLRESGGTVWGMGPGEALDCAPGVHPLLDPIVFLAAFYDLAERVARRRGHDPDRPTRLNKITQTL